MLLLHSIQDNTHTPSKISVLKVIVFVIVLSLTTEFSRRAYKFFDKSMASIQGRRLLRTFLLLKTMCYAMFVFFGMFTNDNTHIKTTFNKVRV